MAQIISGGYIPVTEVPELQEIHMGCWENLTFSEIRERYPEDYEARGKNFADFKPEGGRDIPGMSKKGVSGISQDPHGSGR